MFNIADEQQRLKIIESKEWRRIFRNYKLPFTYRITAHTDSILVEVFTPFAYKHAEFGFPQKVKFRIGTMQIDKLQATISLMLPKSVPTHFDDLFISNKLKYNLSNPACFDDLFLKIKEHAKNLYLKAINLTVTWSENHVRCRAEMYRQRKTLENAISKLEQL